MALSIGSHTWGGAAGIWPRIIQTGDNAADLATGYHLYTGNGTMLPIWFQEDAVALVNGDGFKTLLKGLATADREVFIADRPGTLYPGVEDLVAINPADASTSSTSASDVPDFSLPLAASKLYEFYGSFLCTSAATGTGVHLALHGPTAQTEWVWMEWSMLTGTTLGTNNTRRQQFTAWGTAMENTDSPYTGAPFEIHVRGRCKTSATTPVDPVKLRVDSEVGSSQVQVLASSIMRFRELSA